MKNIYRLQTNSARRQLSTDLDEKRLQRIVGLPLAEELDGLLLLLLELHPGRRSDEIVQQHRHTNLRGQGMDSMEVR